MKALVFSIHKVHDFPMRFVSTGGPLGSLPLTSGPLNSMSVFQSKEMLEEAVSEARGWQGISEVKGFLLPGDQPDTVQRIRSEVADAVGPGGSLRLAFTGTEYLVEDFVTVTHGEQRHHFVVGCEPYTLASLSRWIEVEEREGGASGFLDAGGFWRDVARLQMRTREQPQIDPGEHGLIPTGGGPRIQGTSVHSIVLPGSGVTVGRHVINDSPSAHRGFSSMSESWEWTGATWPDVFELRNTPTNKAWSRQASWTSLEHKPLPTSANSGYTFGLQGGKWYDMKEVVTGGGAQLRGHLWVDTSGSGGARWLGIPQHLESDSRGRWFRGLASQENLAWRFVERLQAPQGDFCWVATGSI